MRNLPIEVTDDEIQPWHSLGGVECICELRKSCAVLYGIFTELARLTYHDTDGRLIGTPDVTWNYKKPTIWIDTELKWEDQHPEVRPAIYIHLEPLKVDEVIPGYNGQVAAADRFGACSYAQHVSGAVTFVHVASTTGEACSLADNTEYMLSSLQNPIRKDFCFTKFVLAGRTPLEKLPDEASEKYASAVTFAFEFTQSWDVIGETPILKSIDLLNSSRHATVNRDNIITETKLSGKNQTKQ